MTSWSVYALLDPRDARVRYVGITSMRLKQRVSNHVCSVRYSEGGPVTKWLRSLEGRKPAVILLRKARSKTQALVYERVYIESFIAAGVDVLNVLPERTFRRSRSEVSQPCL